MSAMMYDFIFVVLVYRNTNDLVEFFNKLPNGNNKVIVVNSFYDKDSEEAFEKIAKDNDSDFFSVPNKGYGAGNNAGCKYALEHYQFKYLVISNADVEIMQMSIMDLEGVSPSVIAPEIINLRGIRQNPNMPYAESKLIVNLRYNAYLKGFVKVMYIFNAISRLKKIWFFLFNRSGKTRKIYSAHGAFFIMPYSIIEKIMPLYNENMFLFNEERYLAKKLLDAGVNTVYLPKVKILHKEDGSVSLLNERTYDLLRASYIEYYKSLYE